MFKFQPVNTILQGDCEQILKKYPSNFVDLIVTSPPYADARVKTYGGIPPEKYIEWFLPKSEQFLRVLKPSGTFILNIKEKVENGERHTYVIELILALRKQGWLWTEEFLWHKTTAFPGKWPNRFRDAWERLLQFNKTKTFNMYQEAVMVEPSENTIKRGKCINPNDLNRHQSVTDSGFGRKQVNCLNREKVYPTNVLYISPVTRSVTHSAEFPKAIPDWFIRLFSKENDIVLDPFAGSGTTLTVAKQLKRKYIGIEIMPQYIDLAKGKIDGI